MANTNHADMTGTNIHVPYTWTYADSTAREAATGFAAGDVGKLAKQSDDNSLWMLIATTPTWDAVGGGGGDMDNPMTTAEDIIVGGASGTPARVAVGDAGQVLGVNPSGDVAYSGGMQLIEQIAVGAGGAASVSFANIPATFKHLELILQARGDYNGSNCGLRMTLNSDTGNNYDYVNSSASSSGATYGHAEASAYFDLQGLVALTATAGKSTMQRILIPNYANTVFQKNISAVGFYAVSQADGGSNDIMLGGTWRDADAITTITIAPSSGNFIEGSVFSLYGRS